MSGRLFAGVDVGASATKVVVVDQDGQVLGKAVCPTRMDFVLASKKALEEALLEAREVRSDLSCVVSTGYGRKNVEFSNASKTEIACHARGAYHSFPEAITIVDIGGQDNKIIKVAADGTRVDFKMNRKCAAGTGAFLEEIAVRIGVGVQEMEGLAAMSTEHVEIGSFCTVFSATEILALVRRGVNVPDIVKGAFRSVVRRIMEMDTLSGKVVVTGGVVAHNPIVIELLSEATGAQVLSPNEPQFSGAMGAALYAIEEEK